MGAGDKSRASGQETYQSSARGDPLIYLGAQRTVFFQEQLDLPFGRRGVVLFAHGISLALPWSPN